MERLISVGRPLLDITAIVENGELENIRFSKKRKLVDLEMENIRRKALKFLVSIGGVESNVALNCAFLGLRSCLTGAVGGDEILDILKKCSKKTGKFESHVQIFPEKRSGIIFVVCEEKGEKKKFIDYSASEYFSWNNKTRKELHKSTILFTSLFSANSLNLKSSWKECLTEAKKEGKKIVINLVGVELIWNKKEIMGLVNEHARVVTMNDVEKCAVESSFGKRITTILSSPDTIIVTNSSRKISVYDKEGSFAVSPKCTHNVSFPFTIGTGDAFTAGFLVAQAKGKNTREAVVFAEEIARKKLEKSCSNFLGEL